MNFYLNFSDAAKIADVARNMVSGYGYHNSFAFFLDQGFDARWIPPLPPFLIAFFMHAFGANDFAVIATSFFFFILTLVFVFLLTNKISKNKIVGFLATLTVGFNKDLINYATNGASESPFIFEIVATSYFLTLKSKVGNVISILLLISMYFTRPQAFIYIAGLILYYLLLNYDLKKVIKYFAIILVTAFLFDKFVLSKLAGNFFLYSVLIRGSNVLSQVGIGESASNQLRSGSLTFDFSILSAFKKLFYNLYNFYKALPEIINPYLFGLFVIGLFRNGYKELKIFTLFATTLTLIVTALSIPFYRYLHPVIPLIYIISILTLSEIITNKLFLTLIVTFFAIGQTLGILILDSRFERKIHNIDKPPVYVLLSQKLKTDTQKDSIILTNLDTWGSWYGERKTVWFPLEPKMVDGYNFDLIYLTSYKMDDANYYMGDNWREIFNNPVNQKVLPDYKFVKEYKINASENYEREDARAVLLIKK